MSDRDERANVSGRGDGISGERQQVLDRMSTAFCIIEVIFDHNGKPLDYRHLDVNRTFELHTGLSDAAGKTALQLIPDLEYAWIERYAQVVLTGEPARFIQPAEAIGRWFEVDAFRVGDPSDNHVGVLFVDVTERVHAQRKVESLLAEKDLLLRETHHRIKNNMSVIQSLLSLEARNSTHQESRKVLSDAVSKLRSMMVLYDRLFNAEASNNHATLQTFLPPLVEQITEILDVRNDVRTDVDVEDIPVCRESLSAIGLLINELVSNSMKHAFNEFDSTPVITVSAKRSDETVRLIYGDNGIGLPDDTGPARAAGSRDGFGMKLIEALADQLQATTRIDRESGTQFVFEFANSSLPSES